MIKINGHTISTVVVSTIMGHHGDGMFPLYFRPSYLRAMRVIRQTNTTVLSKSSTALGRIGNYHPWKPQTWGCIRDLPNMGMINAYELTNDGVASCAKGINLAIKKGFDVIPNFFPEFGDDFELTLLNIKDSIEIFYRKLEEKFWAIELNFSCPNDKVTIEKNIAKAVKLVSRLRIAFQRLTIIAKTSIVHPYEFLQELEIAGVNVFHLINTIPYNTLYPDPKKKSPLHHLGGGGVSGGPAFEMAFEYTSGALKKISKPAIVGCGIVTNEQFRKYREETGAESISICTGLKHNTNEMLTLIKIYNGRKR
jgi:dihydroorotate dehydrogenase (NAD+) catalytic subunit